MSQRRAKLNRKLSGWVKPELPELIRDKDGNVVMGKWDNYTTNRKADRRAEFFRDRTKSKKGAKHSRNALSGWMFPGSDPSITNHQRNVERRLERESARKA